MAPQQHYGHQKSHLDEDNDPAEGINTTIPWVALGRKRYNVLNRQVILRPDAAGVALDETGRKFALIGGETLPQELLQQAPNSQQQQQQQQQLQQSCVSAQVQIIEWDLQKSWNLPCLHQARFGCTAVSWKGFMMVAGGANQDSLVLSSVEVFQLHRPNNSNSNSNGNENENDNSNSSIHSTNNTNNTNGSSSSSSSSSDPHWNWRQEVPMNTPRIYAASVAIPDHHAVLVIGGRNQAWQELSSIEVAYFADDDDRTLVHWATLPTGLPNHPRMGCAAVLIPGKSTSTTSSDHSSNDASSNSILLVMGGYDGTQWQRTSCVYEFSASALEGGSWKGDSASFVPPMLETIRFPKAILYHQYILVMGQEDKTGGTSSCIQCYNIAKRSWEWHKSSSSSSVSSSSSSSSSDLVLDHLALHGTTLYGMGLDDGDTATTSTTTPRSCIYQCPLAKIDQDLVLNCLPLAEVRATDLDDDDNDAPTIVIAAGAVSVAEENVARKSQLPVDNYPLKAVARIMLPGARSYYTGQLRKKDGSWVPHGEGLEVWVDEKDGPASESFGSNKHSYYKGRFVDGYRHGLGEMYLRVEDKHYFGEFEYGSWQGSGTLKMVSRGFRYYGHFEAGEMTGLGRCCFRALHGGEWKERIYSGGFFNGLASGRGTITDMATGKVEEHRDFENEDIFQVNPQSVIGGGSY